MATIRQQKNTRWQAIIRRRGFKMLTKTFSTQEHALMWARYIESEIDRGIFVDRSEAERTSMGELFDRYEREITPHKKSASRERSRLKLLKKTYAGFTASSIQRQHIAIFRDQRISEGKSGATVIKELNLLSHVIDTAIKEWGFPLQSNPAKLIRKPKAEKSRERRLSINEEEILLACCRRSRSILLESIVILAIESCMRLGELLNLHWDDVDLEKRVLYLHKTKNGEKRTVPLSGVAIRVLTLIPRQINNKKVFWKWSSPSGFQHTWRRAVINAKIKDLRFHDLRHEGTSRMFEKGFSLAEVALISGHKTWSMLRRYTHLKAEDLVKKM